MAAASIWERFSLDPRRPEHAHLRAADRDRDVVSDVLATAYAEGRLSHEELEERNAVVARSRTLGELPAIIADLVSTTPVWSPTPQEFRAEAERRYRLQRQQALYAFLTPTLICWAIWGATGGGFMWPLFVMLGTSLRLVRLLTTREDTIVHIQHDLERRERKRLEARRRRDRWTLRPPGPPDQAQGW
jgi:hypothetical protein